MQILQLDPGDQLWQSLTTHLADNGDARWVLDESGQPKDVSLLFLAAVIDGQVVGNLTLMKQGLTVPATEWAGERDRNLYAGDGERLSEMFVQTFSVAEDYRRRGIGRALQEEGLRQTRLMGCYQMRSWSSLDKKANYLLKFGMGFAFQPAIQETAGGLKVSGGYFVMVV
jgi:GNAT superfamily N-acetyltransferase